MSMGKKAKKAIKDRKEKRKLKQQAWWNSF
jgi:hypothetical protein